MVLFWWICWVPQHALLWTGSCLKPQVRDEIVFSKFTVPNWRFWETWLNSFKLIYDYEDTLLGHDRANQCIQRWYCLVSHGIARHLPRIRSCSALLRISWTFHTGDLYFPLSCCSHTADSITMDLSSLCLVKPIEVITTQGGSWLHCFERIETKSRYNDEHWAAPEWWFNKAVESTKWQVLDIREKYRTRSVLAGAGVPVIDWENWVTAPYWQQPPSKYLFWPPR